MQITHRGVAATKNGRRIIVAVKRLIVTTYVNAKTVS